MTKFSRYESDMIQLNSEVLLTSWLSVLFHFFLWQLFVFFLFICSLYDQMKLCYKREPGWDLWFRADWEAWWHRNHCLHDALKKIDARKGQVACHSRSPISQARNQITSFGFSTFQKQKDTGFPRYLKMECSYKTFHKPKWCQMKKQSPFRKSENPLWISFGYWKQVLI